MKKLIFLPIAVVLVLPLFLLNSCPEVIAGTAPRGVYVGIASFDNNPYDPFKDLVQMAGASNTFSSSSLVWLGIQENADTLKNVVDTRYNPSGDTTGGSAIYYSVNRVINRLRSSESYLSDSLDNITFVTFTRGYDQGSADYAPEATGENVKNRIRGSNQATGAGQTTIRGKPINAYAVAIQNPNALQATTLINITSGQSDDDKDYQFTLTNYNDLDAVFKDIASSLTSVSYRSSLTITIQGPSTPAASERFRATFDGNEPGSSQLWIEGKVVAVGDRYEIQPFEGQYITSSNNISFSPQLTKAVQTGRRGILFNFGFPGMTAPGNFNENNIKQFHFAEGEWHELTGANSGSSTRTITEQKAAIIYLILDSSLTSTDIASVRSAAKGFIDTLYDMSRVR